MKRVTGKPSLMKLVNKNVILEILEATDPISRADIAKKSNISAPTVSLIIDCLIKEGLVTEVGEGESSGGRKPTLIAFNATSRYVIGVELKSGAVNCLATDLRGKALINRRYEWDGNRLFIVELVSIIQGFLDVCRSQLNGSVKGIGISVPGVTDIKKGIAIQSTELGWDRVPIRDELEKAFNIPIVVDNDVNMATLGEHWRGAGRNFNDLVFVSIGNGIGAGILLNGELFRGSTFSSGEIGFMVVSPHTLSQLQEGYGPLENHYGEKAIESMISMLSPEDQERKITEATHYLVYAIVNVVCVINPKKVILDLHGVLNERFDIFKALIQKYSPSEVQIDRSSLNNEATLLGAVYSLICSQQSSVSFRHQ